MLDPRLDVIGRRLEPVKRIIAVSSAKGGVGKSVCAALSALALGEAGHRTGLLDLDFQGASAHLLLDVSHRQGKARRGVADGTGLVTGQAAKAGVHLLEQVGAQFELSLQALSRQGDPAAGRGGLGQVLPIRGAD